MGTEIFKE
jgi:hypothetical protein